ncbi:MAG: glycoside hydrolase family 97 N-terminal domain-containing protein, partial [Alistipes sp.]|nr:glycoside hydrolase family 97 N-terminal domain-containing protein [Alistipes sp.]
MKNLFLALALLLGAWPLAAANRSRAYAVTSPDGSIAVTLRTGGELSYELSVDGVEVISRTPVAMTLADGTVWGGDAAPCRVRRGSVDSSFAAPLHIRSQVEERYSWLRADFGAGFAVEVRVYDDGAAYRFVSTADRELRIASETAGARFPGDWTCRIPYVRDCDGEEIVPFGRQFKTSFENLYTVARLSELDPSRLAFLPAAVETDRGVALCFAESDLRSYPGMYLNNPDGGTALRGVFAPYPARTHDGGHDGLQNIVDEYSDFIAVAAPRASFPWRAVLIDRRDCELLGNDLVVRLAAPSRIADTSWIRPGKVAWDWWNAWGVYGVDF